MVVIMLVLTVIGNNKIIILIIIMIIIITIIIIMQMLKYLKFCYCNIWFKKHSHGYVSFINLSYIKTIEGPKCLTYLSNIVPFLLVSLQHDLWEWHSNF